MKNFDYWDAKSIDVSELVGKTLSKIEVEDDEINFVTTEGEEYRMLHVQDCCEGVYIDDVNGDWGDLIGTPITLAEEVSNKEFEEQWEKSFVKESDDYEWRKSEKHGYYPESHTWTFYKFATVKGYVNLRWFGSSNGYYSESVNFYKL